MEIKMIVFLIVASIYFITRAFRNGYRVINKDYFYTREGGFVSNLSPWADITINVCVGVLVALTRSIIIFGIVYLLLM